MEVKLFEVRDRATLVPCIAIKLTHNTPEERWLLRRAGYAEEQICSMSAASNEEPYVLFASLLGGRKAEYDPYSWDNRTYASAHMHAISTWNELKSGDVIDVEYIRGETAVKKTSERTHSVT